MLHNVLAAASNSATAARQQGPAGVPLFGRVMVGFVLMVGLLAGCCEAFLR